MAAKKLTFEQSLEKLEKIVNDIEQGQVPLEESISKYAEGVKLIGQCRGILDQAEKKIQILCKNDDGKLIPSGELDESVSED